MDSPAVKFFHRICFAIPAVLLFVLILLFGSVSIVPGALLPPLLVAWAFIYYWSLFQPQRLHYALLAVAGLLQDLLLGFPLGVSSFCFILLRWLVIQLRRRMHVQHFLVVWAGYALIAIPLAAMMATLLCLVMQRLDGDVLLQSVYAAVISLIGYPLMHVLCNRLYALVPK